MAATGATRVPRVAIVIQEMVDATAAGVAFSRNPLTGLDEVVVEAVPGRGDALVGEGVTPDRWVRRWGAFTESPDAPRVDAAVIEQVARETSRLAAASGHPVDLEWAHDGTTLWWLQARPMTGLDGLRVYSNRIAREVLPGVIKPLVWSVNVPIVNAAWIDLLEELVGPLDVRPEDLARSFGHRAYFDMTTLGDVFAALGMPRDALELLLGLPKGPEAPRFRPTPATYRHMPRLATAAVRSLRRGRWARREVAELQHAYGAIAAIDPRTLDEPGLLARVDALTAITRRAAYANIVVPILMLAYGRALERQLAAAGIDPHAADPTAGRGDRLAWDPNGDLRCSVRRRRVCPRPRGTTWPPEAQQPLPIGTTSARSTPTSPGSSPASAISRPAGTTSACRRGERIPTTSSPCSSPTRSERRRPNARRSRMRRHGCPPFAVRSSGSSGDGPGPSGSIGRR